MHQNRPEKRQKVLLVITKANWGGAQRYVYDLATSLNAFYEVVVAVGGEGELTQQLQHAGVRTITIAGLQRDISLTRELRATLDLGRIIARERPDILHLNSSKVGGIGALLGRIVGVPRIIFTAHAWAFNEDRPLVQRTVIKVLHWLTVLLAHQTITVSEATRQQMDWPFVSSKMSVVHNVYRPAPLLNRDEARERLAERMPALHAHLDDPWTGTVAELHPVKRHDLVIDAFTDIVRAHPHVRHLIMGDGELREELAERIVEAGLEDHIFLLGHVSDAPALLPALDVFTLTSRSEALGYALLEAGAAALPVVATRVGGIPEIISDGETGVLIPEGDGRALASAIRKLLENPELRMTYGAALKEQITNRFSLEKMLARTLACYRS